MILQWFYSERETRTCSLSGTVFTIFYRGWQEHRWWKCQQWVLLSTHATDFSLTVFLKRHHCTGVWRKVKLSAALPNNPRHNLLWMTASRKEHVHKMQKRDKCKTRRTAKVCLTADVKGSGIYNQRKEISTLLMRKLSLQQYNMLSLVEVQVKKQEEVKERGFERRE